MKTTNNAPDPSDNSWKGTELGEKSDLANPLVPDNKLMVPRLLSQITDADAEAPLLDIPPDSLGDIYYQTRYEPRCVLCRAPGNLRERSEHWFIENAFKPASVCNFFMRYFGAKVSWECVSTHMAEHCINLQNYNKCGLKSISMRRDEIAQWKYRELELVIDTLLLELDEVKGLDIKKSPELFLKKSQRVESITKSLREATKQRDEAGTEVVNVFEILKDLFERLTDPGSKVILRDYVKELRAKLAEA